MVKITYYRGNIEEIGEVIDSVKVNCDEITGGPVNLAMMDLIKKHYNKEVYYYRTIMLEPNKKHSIDFGSYLEFIMLEIDD